jgi:hypothetical protein
VRRIGHWLDSGHLLRDHRSRALACHLAGLLCPVLCPLHRPETPSRERQKQSKQNRQPGEKVEKQRGSQQTNRPGGKSLSTEQAQYVCAPAVQRDHHANRRARGVAVVRQLFPGKVEAIEERPRDGSYRQRGDGGLDEDEQADGPRQELGAAPCLPPSSSPCEVNEALYTAGRLHQRDEPAYEQAEDDDASIAGAPKDKNDLLDQLTDSRDRIAICENGRSEPQTDEKR